MKIHENLYTLKISTCTVADELCIDIEIIYKEMFN